MNSNANRNLKIGFGLSIILLIFSSLVSYICIDRLLENAALARKTNQLTRTLEQVVSQIRLAEAAERGYLITNNVLYLTPFNEACQESHDLLDEVLLQIKDDPLQLEIGQRLKKALSLRIERLNFMVDSKTKTGSFDEKELEIGRAYMEDIRTLSNQMISEANAQLEGQTELRDRFGRYAPGVIILAALLAILIAFVFYIRIVRDMAERTKLVTALEEQDLQMRHRLSIIHEIASQISAGDYSVRVNDEEKDTLGSLAGSLNRMAESLALSFERLANNEWLQSGLADLNEKMVGEKQVELICQEIITFLAEYTGSHTGAIYLLHDHELVLQSGYALQADKANRIAPGQGIAGQALRDKKAIVLSDIEAHAVIVSHATGGLKPAAVIAFPIFHEREEIGVIELAAMKPFAPRTLAFFSTVSANIGTAIYGAQSRKRLQELLEETQSQAEELQAQHEELESLNVELEAHAQKLQASEEELKVQQEELQQTNLDLEERNRVIRERNAEILAKAKQLEESSRYKTEFMANMSHELRTPLNSILLLSRYLAENSDQNLTDDQKESARVIYNSGNGLLQLIDELLDLSKIEAGKMDVEYTEVSLDDVLNNMESTFGPVARDKELDLKVSYDLPGGSVMSTDRMKLEQILKNLLSNGLKFTSNGQVSLTVRESGQRPGFLEFCVEDTGPGIPADKLSLIFEAFTQGDGSTKREYGGTGLGLSISRQLAQLLGGEIQVTSQPGQGSSFTLTLPKHRIRSEEKAPERPIPSTPSHYLETQIPQPIPDDRENILPGDNVILIVEDDTVFARELLRFTRRQHYKGVVAVRGDEAMGLALQHTPRAILLDIKLPVKDGWQVLDELKSNPQTRHIPVHIMSSLDAKKESRIQGAADFFSKPLAVTHMREMFAKLETIWAKGHKSVLIVEENAKHAEALAYFLESFEVSSSIKKTVDDSVASLLDNEAECVILDMGLPTKNPYDLLERIKHTPGLEDVPIIVFTGKNPSTAEELRLRQYADTIVVKTAYSYQRIIDEVAIFLHLVETQQDSLTHTGRLQLSARDVLNGRTALIADDDIRNIFSLTKTLEKLGMQVVSATDGREALERLDEHPETDIVIMDMMMPHLDGYESTAKIRNHPRFGHLPIIAVTAKAMMGDREKCIAAGASDYISKPVDIDQLISLLRVWLYDEHR